MSFQKHKITKKALVIVLLDKIVCFNKETKSNMALVKI